MTDERFRSNCGHHSTRRFRDERCPPRPCQEHLRRAEHRPAHRLVALDPASLPGRDDLGRDGGGGHLAGAAVVRGPAVEPSQPGGGGDGADPAAAVRAAADAGHLDHRRQRGRGRRLGQVADQPAARRSCPTGWGACPSSDRSWSRRGTSWWPRASRAWRPRSRPTPREVTGWLFSQAGVRGRADAAVPAHRGHRRRDVRPGRSGGRRGAAVRPHAWAASAAKMPSCWPARRSAAWRSAWA